MNAEKQKSAKRNEKAFSRNDPGEGCFIQKNFVVTQASAGAPTGQTLAQVPQLMH